MGYGWVVGCLLLACGVLGHVGELRGAEWGVVRYEQDDVFLLSAVRLIF